MTRTRSSRCTAKGSESSSTWRSPRLAPRPDGFEVAVCGEHSGDPTSITWCHEHAVTYVSCSLFRVTVARLAAAQAALAESD
ncbi:MAG TPA: putative PEP-binding protein [Propionibacteriaceae bacterium]|nr:putative PEP-binding protein [Propionibacteriaceae bacterium]